MVAKFDSDDIHFQSITDGINATTPAGRFFFHLMTSLSEMERELLIEMTKARLAAAKKGGRVGGRKRIMTPSKVETVKKFLTEGMPPKEVANNLGVSIPTLYRWCPSSERSEFDYNIRGNDHKRE